MATKTRPGVFDCYAAAKEDEPMFVLLGRDPMAPTLVRAWAKMRVESGEDGAKVQEALRCADEMEAYSKQLGKPKITLTIGSVGWESQKLMRETPRYD